MPTGTITVEKQTRIQLFAFIIALAICLLFSAVFGVFTLAKYHQSGKIELDGRINPNNAPVASLMRLPGVGLGRAQAIAAYREDFLVNGGQPPVFKDCNDLQKVKGIGPATVRNIKLLLQFE